VTHVPLCSIAGCPAPSDESWHRCFCCDKQPIHHHHVLRRSTHPDKKLDSSNIVALCPYHHRLVTEHKWSDLIYAHPNGEMHYNVKDENGQDKCDRAIGTWQETAQDARETAPADLALAPTNLAIPSQPAIRYERRALVIEGPLSWERYEELCATLETMEEAVGFWIGDAIIRGEQEFGERAYQPWTAKGYKAERLRQYAWVAQQFPPVTRVSLSWTHHRIAAALPEPQALLERAVAEDLSTRELREIVQGAKPEEGCHHSWRCELCGATK